ncbi:MAG: hypothetical protein ACRD2L_04675 [Terriglobia bacterium]
MSTETLNVSDQQKLMRDYFLLIHAAARTQEERMEIASVYCDYLELCKEDWT